MLVIGTIGALCLAFCALPQVIKVWKTQDTKALSVYFLLVWFIGEVLTWIYVIWQNISIGIIQWPLHLNYVFNIVLLVYLLYKKAHRSAMDNGRQGDRACDH
jgi:uncharacterized protein with PQ loop repeat